MRSAKGWLACLMALAIGFFVLGAPPQARATFQIALQEDAGPITPVVSGASFSPLTIGGTFGDYSFSFLNAVASQGAGASNLLSSATSITSLVAATHTLNVFVSNTDFTLPVGPQLSVMSGMGGTYGSEPGFTGAATFQMWADAANGLRAIPGTFTNGLQPAVPASGNGRTFDTGIDPTNLFIRGAGPHSVTSEAIMTTTGLGDVNFSTHLRLAPVSTPEPGTTGTLLLMGLGFGGMFIGARRRKS